MVECTGFEIRRTGLPVPRVRIPLAALIDTNTNAQGDAFEIFVEAYLATQPLQQCQETWLVGDIPIEVREALNLPRDSKGINGV